MNALIKDCIKLVTITVIAGAALGAVYGITKAPIAAQEEKAQMEAYAAVFPEAAEVLASGENPIAGHDDDEITSVVEAVDASGESLGYIFNVTTAEGYGGDISLTVGIQADGTVNGYSILSINETAGLGMNAQNEEWASQFADKNVDAFTVVKDGSGANDDAKIDAISGATITSEAVAGAMNSCIIYFHTLEGGN